MNKLAEGKVCVVAVTFNRKDLLIECLHALQRQTRPVDAIYIIDNASTDGTPELLKQFGYIQTLPPLTLSEHWETPIRHKNEVKSEALNGELLNSDPLAIYYVRMHENTGGSGGFHEGVKRGYEKGFHWLWLMDDDVKATENALMELLAYKELSKCIHPSKSKLNRELFYWDGYFNVETMRRYNSLDANFQKDYTFVNVGCFEGMLIHRDIVKKIGYPDKRFFITWDDTIYGLKASRHTNVLLSSKILINKTASTDYPLSASYFYYFLRNLFLAKEILDEDYPQHRRKRKNFFVITVFSFIVKIFKKLSFFEALGVIKNGISDGRNKKFFKKP